MTVRNATWNWARALTAAAVATVCLHVAPAAQDRLKSMPGYDQFQKMTKDTLSLAASLATPTITWSDDSSAFDYVRDGKLYRFDVAARQASVVGDAPQGRGRGGRGLVAGAAQGRGDAQPAPARGRQFDSEESPDKNRKAFYRDRNLWLVDADGSNEIALTTDGNDKDRIKYGTASWVYGEELDQRTAMWWSPDSRKLAYYRFDEKQVLDYYLQMTQTEIQDTLDVEAYPKPGRPNPIVDLFVYDVATKKTTKMDVRDGKPFADEVVGHYVYDVEWSPDRQRAVREPHESTPERARVRALRARHRQVPRDRARRMADRLGRQQPAANVPQGRPTLHLGIRTQRLEELLSLRPEREAC